MSSLVVLSFSFPLLAPSQLPQLLVLLLAVGVHVLSGGRFWSCAMHMVLVFSWPYTWADFLPVLMRIVGQVLECGVEMAR